MEGKGAIKMKLRLLKKRDASLMLEWMHDISITENLYANFTEKDINDCEEFIIQSTSTEDNLHLAIVNDADEYYGTVSLKNIGQGMAEFAIVLRKIAMGNGYSSYATSEIIKLGFQKYHLDRVYWYVSSSNTRACRFYDKQGFTQVGIHTNDYKAIIEHCGFKNEVAKKYRWYQVMNHMKN